MALAVLGALAVAMPAAHASIIFQLNNGGSCCSPGPFGNIEVTQTTSSLVTITETLAPGENFAGTGAGEALAFNIAGDPSIIITISAGNLANFAAGVGTTGASPFGTFDYFVHCTTCAGGSGPTGPLTFTVQLSSLGALDINSFKTLSVLPPGSTQAYMASDICYHPGSDTCNTNPTGNVGSTGFSSVPEPISLSLVGGGLLALGVFRKRFVA